MSQGDPGMGRRGMVLRCAGWERQGEPWLLPGVPPETPSQDALAGAELAVRGAAGPVPPLGRRTSWGHGDAEPGRRSEMMIVLDAWEGQ